jgi:serine/threonine-protein kinase HipA
MRKAKIYYNTALAGYLTENEDGYSFVYDKNYLKTSSVKPVSLTLPLQEKPHVSKVIFPFFDGLIPEGWLLEIAEKNWKLNARDRMGLLLACCRDCIGAISVEEDNS